MSLMNDALRKKDREGSGNKSDATAFAPSSTKRKARKWIILFMTPLVLCVILFGGMALLRVRANESLLARTLPGNFEESPPPAETKAATKETTAPPLENEPPEPVVAPPPPPSDIEPGPAPPDRAPIPVESLSSETEKRISPVIKPKPIPHKSALAKRKAPPPSDQSELFFRKAAACHRVGRLQEAARFYRSVLKADADHREATANLAAVYIEQKNFNQAFLLLRRLEKATPRPEGVLLNLAIASMGNQAPNAALGFLDRAEAAGDAPEWQIRFHRAVAMASLNRLPEALTLYKAVESQRPDDYRVKFNLAITHDALGDYPQALDYYNALLKADHPVTQADRPAIISRIGALTGYLNRLQSQGKRQ